MNIYEIKKEEAGRILKDLPIKAYEDYSYFIKDKNWKCINEALHNYICCDTCCNFSVKKAEELFDKYSKYDAK